MKNSQTQERQVDMVGSKEVQGSRPSQLVKHMKYLCVVSLYMPRDTAQLGTSGKKADWVCHDGVVWATATVT